MLVRNSIAHTLLGGNEHDKPTLKNSLVGWYKANVQITIQINNTLKHLSHRNENLCLLKKTCTQMFIADWFKRANTGNTQHPSTGEWSDKLCGTFIPQILRSNKKERSTDTGNNLDELCGVEKPHPKKLYAIWSHLYNVVGTCSLF